VVVVLVAGSRGKGKTKGAIENKSTSWRSGKGGNGTRRGRIAWQGCDDKVVVVVATRMNEDNRNWKKEKTEKTNQVVVVGGGGIVLVVSSRGKGNTKVPSRIGVSKRSSSERPE
jgi:hypothetical protein